MTGVAWKNRRGCFLGLLKLELKTLMASLESYVLSSFSSTHFINWLCTQFGLKMPAFLIIACGQRTLFITQSFIFFFFSCSLIFHKLVKKLIDIKKKKHQKIEYPPEEGKSGLTG